MGEGPTSPPDSLAAEVGAQLLSDHHHRGEMLPVGSAHLAGEDLDHAHQAVTSEERTGDDGAQAPASRARPTCDSISPDCG
jgi:hypothetical protein